MGVVQLLSRTYLVEEVRYLSSIELPFARQMADHHQTCVRQLTDYCLTSSAPMAAKPTPTYYRKLLGTQ